MPPGPRLADLHARHEHETFNLRLVELTRLGAVLASTALAPIVAYNRRFFELWIHDPTLAYGGDAVILIAAFNAFLIPAISLWNWCFTATGRHDSWSSPRSSRRSSTCS